MLSSIVAASICNPTNTAGGLPFLHFLPALVCYVDDSLSDRCEVVSHCGSGLSFPEDY